MAEVNDVKIHEYEISMYFSLNEEEQKKAIDRAAALYLIYDYALKKGFTVSDMEVQSQLKLEEEWIQEATNKEIFYDYIAGLDMTASEYLQSQYNVRRNEMMAQKLYESIKAEISKASPDISADDLKKSTDDRLSQLKSQLMKNAVIKYYNN
ncbi:hypothetical protein SDC9_113102 [bioreactor metagenome]|uniref:Trigger factor C-terminal domain-containing protein n=1 Tax=bioreactor metagenome TaxID=1076179 RepID=A0A645BLI8_9ZZZZ